MQTNKTSSVFFIVRLTDKFGDSWPLGTIIDGIDGVRYESEQDAIAFAEKFQSDKALQVELRNRNRWEKGTIKGISVSQVSQS